MNQALEASSYVYQGVWTNWSKGSIMGVTLTLSPQKATAVVAILAIFVQMAGSQSWMILRFALHQIRASAGPKDGFYHQQQAILRNSPSDISTAGQLVQSVWAWRRHTKRPLPRTLFLICCAFCHFLFFLLAGIFSSNLANAGGDVLSRSPFCGTLNTSFTSTFLGGIDYATKMERDAQLSQEYVELCYNTTTTSASCNVFPRRQLDWKTSLSKLCLFEAPVCLDKSLSIQFDTGFLDSQDDLGLNARETDRISYRRVTSCSPLNDAQYIGDWMYSSFNSTTQLPVIGFYHGPSPDSEFFTSDVGQWDIGYDSIQILTRCTCRMHTLGTSISLKVQASTLFQN